MKGKVQTVDEAIRIEAYLLSEKAGHPSGMEHYFWEQALAIVQARKTAVAGAVKQVAKKKTAAKAPVKLKAAAKGKAEATPKVEVKPRAETKPKVEAKPKAAAKPKTNAAKKPAVNGANGKNHPLSLDGAKPPPARNRPLKK